MKLYVIHYTFNSNIKKLFNEAGYACVYLPRSTGSQDLDLDHKIEMPISPIDWYNLIRFSNNNFPCPAKIQNTASDKKHI